MVAFAQLPWTIYKLIYNKIMISQKNMQRIKMTGIKIDHQMAFGGKSAGNKHLFRVVKIANYLARKAKAESRPDNRASRSMASRYGTTVGERL
jgi:hypothetical protein